jgi:hypothetical protein
MDSSIGNTIVYDQDFDWGPGTFQQPHWDELVVYELHIGTYNVELGGGPGRIQGVIDRLDHLRNVDGGRDPGADIPDGWALMARINGEIAARQPWKVSIAEDMQNDEWVTRRPQDGGAGFTAQWESGGSRRTSTRAMPGAGTPRSGPRWVRSSG